MRIRGGVAEKMVRETLRSAFSRGTKHRLRERARKYNLMNRKPARRRHLLALRNYVSGFVRRKIHGAPLVSLIDRDRKSPLVPVRESDFNKMWIK